MRYILKTERTEYGKMIRKEYEQHKVRLKRMDFKCYNVRSDGTSGTITGATKDNYVLVIC